MITFFTICTAEQYPFAALLGQSLPSDARFFVGLVTGKIAAANVISAEELGLPNWHDMRERYDDDALIAACKPFFADFFLQQPNTNQVVYFDPTVQVFGDISLIYQELETASILLTPCLLRPMWRVEYGDEKHFLNTGMYNAGFFALQNDENTAAFLRWWQARAHDRAHFDLCHGQNHDQLWLNLVPVYFQGVKIIKNQAWNVGLHNLHERVLTQRGGSWWVNNQEPLLFFNFRECVANHHSIQTILEKSGAKSLLSSYLNNLKTIPSIFSIYQKLHPIVPAWKRFLRRELTNIIAGIDQFPLTY